MALTRITEGVIKPNENYVVNNINSSGVTTSTNFKTGTSNLHNVGIEIAGINVLGADTPIGTGATIYDAGGAVFTGVVTATNFSGSGNIGGVDGNFSGNVTAVDATFTGNVSIGGTLTYEDVTNIDSVGVITARDGIILGGGNITLADRPDGNSQNLFFGTGAKAAAYHDGTNFTLINNTGHTYIGIGAANKDLMLYAQSTGNIILQRNTGHKYFEGVGSDGTAKIYHNTNEKIRTTSTGAIVTGILTATGNVDIAHGSGQAHYQITQTNGNTVKMGIVSGSDFEISGSSNNDIILKRAGSTRLTITTDGATVAPNLTANAVVSNYGGITTRLGFVSGGAEGVVETTTNHSLVLGTNSTERLRITTDGILSWRSGVASALSGTSNNYSINIYRDSGSGYGYLDCITGSTSHTGWYMRAYHNGTYNKVIAHNTSDSTWFETGGDERLRITSGGRVNIANSNQTGSHLDYTRLNVYGHTSHGGTNKNLNLLNVYNYGDGNVGNITGIGLGCGASPGGYTKASIGFIRTGTYGRGDLIFCINSQGNGNQVVEGDERLRITKDGNVAIGNASPQQLLHVWPDAANTTSAYIRVTAGDRNSNTGLDIGHDASGNGHVNMVSNGTLTFSTLNSPRIKIANNSAATSIGGSMVFNAMLTTQGDVSGGLLMLKAAENTNRLFVSGTDSNGVEVNLYDEAGGQKGILGVSGTEFFIKAPNNSAPITFHTHNGSSIGERLRITSAGVINIGVGNESSAVENLVELYVGGNDTSHATIRGKYNRGNEYNRSEVRFGVESNAAGKGFLAFATGTNSATEKLRITSGGRVGVGEADPDHIFHIKGSTPILGVESSSWVSGVSAALRLSYTAGDAREIRGHYEKGLIFTLNQGEAMRIHTSNKVGINQGGSYNPLTSLDVRHPAGTAGNATKQSLVTICAGRNSTRGLEILTGHPTTGSQNDAGVYYNAKDTDSGAYHAQHVWQMGGGNAMVLGYTGKYHLGIGENYPAYPLDISYTDNTAWQNGSIGNGVEIHNKSETAGTYAGLHLYATGDGATAAASHISCVHTANGTGDLSFANRHAAGGHAERMRLHSDGILKVHQGVDTNSDIGGHFYKPSNVGYCGTQWTEQGAAFVFYMGELVSSSSSNASSNYVNCYASHHWGDYPRLIIWAHERYYRCSSTTWTFGCYGGTGPSHSLTQTSSWGSVNGGHGTDNAGSVSVNHAGHVATYSGSQIHRYDLTMSNTGTYGYTRWYIGVLKPGARGIYSSAVSTSSADSASSSGGGTHLKTMSQAQFGPISYLG